LREARELFDHRQSIPLCRVLRLKQVAQFNMSMFEMFLNYTGNAVYPDTTSAPSKITLLAT